MMSQKDVQGVYLLFYKSRMMKGENQIMKLISMQMKVGPFMCR